MAQYRVKVLSFIGNAIAQPDDVVEFDGIPGDNLEPIDKPAKAASAKAEDANAQSMARQAKAAMGMAPDAG